MSIDNVKKYFTPQTILDIGANVGQFYNKCKNVFPDDYYYLIEVNKNCEESLQTYNVDYSIELLSDENKDVEILEHINHPLTYELIQQDVLFINKNLLK